MSWPGPPSGADSEAYLKAVEETQIGDTPGVGYYDPVGYKDNANGIRNINRQLNTVISLLINLTNRVDKLEKSVGKIKVPEGTSAPAVDTKKIDQELDLLIEKMKAIPLITPESERERGKKFVGQPSKKSPYYILPGGTDPLKIVDEEFVKLVKKPGADLRWIKGTRWDPDLQEGLEHPPDPKILVKIPK